MTRGDGDEGEELELERLGDAAPRQIAAGVLAQGCEVRGELLVPRAEFALLAAELGYRSARNCVAGLLRNERPRDARLPLRFVAYGLEAAKVQAADYHLRVALLRELGFATCRFWQLHRSFGGVRAALVRLAEGRASLEYETDGAVLKLDSRRQSEALGATRHHPRHSLAWKWSAAADSLPVTTLRSVEWQVDQSGCLRPVGVVDPPVVCPDGARLTRASLHNWAFVARHRLAPGTLVQLERAGGTVPHLIPLPVAPASPEPAPPSCCPCPLGAPVEAEPPLHLRCSRGTACPERVAYRAYAVGSGVLQIRGLGLATARAMAAAGLLRPDAPWDAVRLSAAQLAEMGPGWGPVRAARLAAETTARVREATFAQTLGTILAASGVGRSGWARLAAAFPSLAKLAHATEAELAELPELGVISAATIRARINEQTLPWLEEELGRVPLPLVATNELTSAHLPLLGMQVVVTGKLSVPRSQLAEHVRALGGSVVAGVSGKTSVLVVGENPTQDKVAKATRLSIPVEKEQEFRKRFD